ncbi:hypothetical protein LQR30_15750 [Chromobacterium piscinae]|uniref:hypothetical protein n=1 Tax=Chromobacterium piscinae TaxID=686831 RepID=UPI001E363635|nr:hypothetical protein [Chromobacterium piscinae]MCD4505553.1 hypothetical protein [Chromobacterium piscinae]
MTPGTSEQLAAAAQDARALPFDTIFVIGANGDWKHLAGQRVHRRHNGGFSNPDGVSMCIADAINHQTIIAEASDLIAPGAMDQGELYLQRIAICAQHANR